MSAGIEPTGSMDDIEQGDPDAIPVKPVPVTVDGPVRVQSIPSRSWSSRNRAVPLADGPVRIAPADARRATLSITPTEAAIYIGVDQAACAAGVAAICPANVAAPALTHRDEVWVAAIAVDAVVSVIEELWAD